MASGDDPRPGGAPDTGCKVTEIGCFDPDHETQTSIKSVNHINHYTNHLYYGSTTCGTCKGSNPKRSSYPV
ncbi:hypothetical protein N7471_004105 [Penicillium samsonianum]|uniref:uncharacterized protein n=1 Tax=Penicillium samsonianum TaxID=1882272 RepID=UPI0025478009|nr:uncharacterized protein N7471_004105 [Penicillium samsonianum]KAJ6137619.1 hypothetical protein N7471_004105 [Penicillium samsonianum]